MKEAKFRIPLVGARLDKGRLETAARLVTGIAKSPNASAGIRRALKLVDSEPIKAVSWVIGRYGDPEPVTRPLTPVMWQAGMYLRQSGYEAVGQAVSGLNAELKAIARAYGRGNLSRGIAFAIDYADGAGKPCEYIWGGEDTPAAKARYKVWTLERHVAYYLGLKREYLAAASAFEAASRRVAELKAGPAPTDQHDTDWMDQ